MSKFVNVLNKAYKSILTEAGPGGIPMPGGAMDAAPSPPGAPLPPPAGAPAGGAPQEQPVETPATRSSSDAFLIGMIAKALLINIDEDDKLKIIKYLKGLDEDSATAVEENLVNLINGYGYENLDEDLDDIDVPPKKARKVLKMLKNVMKEYVDTETGEE
jgi:hypothetical protein